jgi:polar amino acid transport system substrate-binding protein
MKPYLAALFGATLLTGAALGSSQAGASGAGIFTSAQVTAGAKTYAASCSKCHGASLEGVSAPALRGAGSGIAGDTVSEAYKFISTQMPAGNPGSLSGTEYTNVMAYILSRNGHAAGMAHLTPGSAAKSTLKL